jgi:hypothetical protein
MGRIPGFLHDAIDGHPFGADHYDSDHINRDDADDVAPGAGGPDLIGRRVALSRAAAAGAATLASVSAAAAAAGSVMAVPLALPRPARAVEGPAPAKLSTLPDDEVLERIVKDVTVNQFLVSGRISRDLYDEDAVFQDNIDTYKMDQWMVGTARLFLPDRSRVVLTEPPRIVPGTRDVRFRFADYLTFNVPLLLPVAYLTGTVTLERRNGDDDGLITAYREVWDQDVATVLTSLRYFGDTSEYDDRLDSVAVPVGVAVATSADN